MVLGETAMVDDKAVGRPREGLPYMPGTKRDDFVFVSGQVAWDESGNMVGEGDIAAQTCQVLSNVRGVPHRPGIQGIMWPPDDGLRFAEMSISD